MHCTNDEPQTAALVQWRHISTALTFQSSATKNAWRVTQIWAGDFSGVPQIQLFNKEVS
jgi:hypothetical protein